MSDYLSLNYQELKQYIKAHPQDEEAFQHFLTLMRQKPGVVVNTPEQLEAELRKRINQAS
jgi:Xaa-Pro aminopeptidase